MWCFQLCLHSARGVCFSLARTQLGGLSLKGDTFSVLVSLMALTKVPIFVALFCLATGKSDSNVTEPVPLSAGDFAEVMHCDDQSSFQMNGGEWTFVYGGGAPGIMWGDLIASWEKGPDGKRWGCGTIFFVQNQRVFLSQNYVGWFEIEGSIKAFTFEICAEKGTLLQIIHSSTRASRSMIRLQSTSTLERPPGLWRCGCRRPFKWPSSSPWPKSATSSGPLWASEEKTVGRCLLGFGFWSKITTDGFSCFVQPWGFYVFPWDLASYKSPGFDQAGQPRSLRPNDLVVKVWQSWSELVFKQGVFFWAEHGPSIWWSWKPRRHFSTAGFGLARQNETQVEVSDGRESWRPHGTATSPQCLPGVEACSKWKNGTICRLFGVYVYFVLKNHMLSCFVSFYESQPAG